MGDITTFDHLGLDAMRSGDAVDNADISATLKRIRIPISSEAQEMPLSSEETYSIHASSGERHGEHVAQQIATVTTISSLRMEVPRINPEYQWNGHYKFVYGAVATRDGNLWNAIGKVDVSDGSHVVWTEPDDEFGVFMGEPIFIPSPSPKTEDDGVIVVSGLHITSKRGFFMVVNATSMTEIARAWTKN